LKGLKARPYEGIPDPFAPPVADDEAGIAEHLQVMAHRRLGFAEWFDEFAHADLASLRGGEDRDDPEPGGVSQSGKACRQFNRSCLVERGRKDRRTARLSCGVDQSTSVGHGFPLALTSVDASTIINASMDTNAIRGRSSPEPSSPLKVADIDSAVEFYSKLFGTEPPKRCSRYTNFAIAEPPLKLVLIKDADQTPGTLDQLGVEVETNDKVTAARNHLTREGLTTAMEEQTTCCYALQDKVWVHGPGGEPWEIYAALTDAEMSGEMLRSTPPGKAVCCDTHRELGAVATGARSCC
jgi:hypothetical protein